MHRSWFCVRTHAQPCHILLWSQGLWPVRLLCPWDFPGKYTGVDSHFLLRSSQPRDRTHVSWVSWITGRFYTTWAIKILCIDASVSQLRVSHANSDTKRTPEVVPQRCPGSRRQSPSSCREMLCGSALVQWRNAPSGSLWYFYCELPENNRTNGFQGNWFLKHVGFHHYKNNIDLW